MNLIGKKVLVTGADGFIGSHLTEELVRRGCSVRAFVYYNSFNSWGWLDQSPKEIQDSIEIFQGDIRDPYRVKAALQGCNVVFHLAALVAIPFSYHSPDAYIDTNVKGTLYVLQSARTGNRAYHTALYQRVYGTAGMSPSGNASSTGTVPLCRVKDRGRPACAFVLPFVFHTGFSYPSIQHIWPASVQPCDNSNGDNTDSAGKAFHSAGFRNAYKRFHSCE
jgi:hypothetical protein